MNDAPNLLEIVQTWLKTKQNDRFVVSSNNIVCKCCKVIWIKVLNDRVRYGFVTRVVNGTVNSRHQIYEMLAVNKQLFDRLDEVLEKAEHISK